MGDVWLDLASSLFRPARPALARCLAERERHLEERTRAAEARQRAIADCERRIEALRAAVFAASDGVVGARMTELERAWRSLAKVDPDANLMNLWARIARTEWHDRKVWRSCPAIDRLDLCVALASDMDGIEAAEHAARTLGSPRILWRFVARDRALFVTTHRPSPRRIREDVRDAVLARYPDRPLLARDIGHLAAQRPSRALDALRAIWRSGYGIQAIDAAGITLETPPL